MGCPRQWIPAFAGMTVGKAGMTVEAGMAVGDGDDVEGGRKKVRG